MHNWYRRGVLYGCDRRLRVLNHCRIINEVILAPRRETGMASPTDFALKHSVATAVAIPATVATNWYLETLSAAGIALVFVLFLAVFNAIAAFVSYRKKSLSEE